jgi:hypothetical protein
VFFLRFVVHDGLLFTTGFLEDRVEDFLFKTGVDSNFHFQLVEQFSAFFHGALGGIT